MLHPLFVAQCMFRDSRMCACSRPQHPPGHTASRCLGRSRQTCSQCRSQSTCFVRQRVIRPAWKTYHNCADKVFLTFRCSTGVRSMCDYPVTHVGRCAMPDAPPRGGGKDMPPQRSSTLEIRAGNKTMSRPHPPVPVPPYPDSVPVYPLPPPVSMRSPGALPSFVACRARYVY